MPNGISCPYQLDESILNLRVVGLYFTNSFKISKYVLKANTVESDQTLQNVASDLVLHCLRMSHKKDAWLIRVKPFVYWIILRAFCHFKIKFFEKFFQK